MAVGLGAVVLLGGCAAEPSSSGSSPSSSAVTSAPPVTTSAPPITAPAGSNIPIITSAGAQGLQDLSWQLDERDGDLVHVTVAYGCSGAPRGAWLEPVAGRIRLHVVGGPAPAPHTVCPMYLIEGQFTVVLPAGDGSKLLES